MFDFDPKLVFDLLLAAACGAALGLERELQHKPAGLRTNMLIALGSALFTYSSIALVEARGEGDPSRIAAQIVTGIGFLGAGTILRHRDQIIGLTSAATVWVVASIGVLAGANRPMMALGGTAIALAILVLVGRLEALILERRLKCRLTIDAREREAIQSDVENRFRRAGIQIDQVERHATHDGRLRLEIHYLATRGRHERARQVLAALDGVEQIHARIL